MREEIKKLQMELQEKYPDFGIGVGFSLLASGDGGWYITLEPKQKLCQCCGKYRDCIGVYCQDTYEAACIAIDEKLKAHKP